MSAAKSIRDIKFRQRPWPEPPITADGIIPPLVDLDALILRNGGTATVNLWGGSYTLASGETISFNVTQDDSTLDFSNVPVTFDTSTGGVKLLQIITVKSSPC